jgi:predicted aspartyl protease
MRELTGLALWCATVAAGPSPAHVRELIEADRVREAVEEARTLAVSSPGDLDATACLGESLYRAGRIEEAGAALEAIAGSPGAPARATAQLGMVRAAQGRDEEAGALLERALAAAPEDRWVIYRAAGAARSRAEGKRLLGEYVARSAGDDPDRIEGAKGTMRLYDALGEKRIWTVASRPERLEARLAPLVGSAARGWIVEARLKGNKKIRLLLDTGSTGLFVVERAVKKAGFTPLADETVFAGGETGRARSSRGLLETLAIGDLVFKDALVTTSRDEFDPQGRIHGVLGIAALAGYLVTLDLDRGRLVLEPAPQEPAGEPYWSVGGQMLVRATADGAPQDGLFLFDTGATRSMLATSYAGTIAGARDSGPSGVRTYGGNVQGATALSSVVLRFAGVPLGTETVNRSDLTQRSRLGGVEIAGFLGLDALDGAVITIDTTHQRVRVTPRARRAE